MNCKYISSRLLFRHLKYISIFLFCSVVFLPLSAFGANVCSGKEPSIISDIQKIACSTEDLQVAVENDLLKKMAKLIFDATVDDPRDIIRGVEPLSSSNQDLTEKVSQFHEDRISAGRIPYTIDITAYPKNWKKGSCAKKYKTIEPVGTEYRPIKGKTPRSFEVRYDPEEEEFFMCENTDLSLKQRERVYCGYSKGCKNRCGGSESCEDKCDDSKNCKKALFISCRYADTKGAVTTDKQCLSLDDYEDLSKELFLGSGWFSFSNPALEKNCPDGCSYYTQTLQRVYQKAGDEDACSDNYVIVHCGPKKKKSKFKNEDGEEERDYLYNLNIKEVKNLCTDFDLVSGCSTY